MRVNSKIVLFAILPMASLCVSASAQMQMPMPATPAPPTSPNTDAVAAAAGTQLIPGVQPNPLAAPGSLPGPNMGGIILQPHIKMTTHRDFTLPDEASYSKTMFDLFEYRPKGRDSDVRWDIERWQGGDYRRLWFKTEGEHSTINGNYTAEFQVLNSKLIKPYTEFQYGLRLQTRHDSGTTSARPQAVVGFQAFMPYKYDLETALYVDPHGKISGSAKATKDLMITQRLILQPRLEADAGLQQDERFRAGAGLTDVSAGLRLRYEIRREFAPYIGITYQKSFGKTASFARQDGGAPSQWRFVTGVRAWF